MKKPKSMLPAIIIVLILSLIEFGLRSIVTWEREGTRLGYQKVQLYHYPAPPVGRWTAIYSNNFAKEYKLPEINISNQLNDYIEYIEIVVVPNDNKALTPAEASQYPNQDCIINIIAKKNHDISLGESIVFDENKKVEAQISAINNRMQKLDKPLQSFNIKKHIASYRSIQNFGDFTIHSPDLFPQRDYFSIRDLWCRNSVSSLKQNKDLVFNHLYRASVFGENIIDLSKVEENENWDNPDRYRTVKIPQSILLHLYEGIEVPPEPSNFPITSLIDIPKIIIASPLLLAMQFDSSGSKTKWERQPVREAWPVNIPTHFKLSEHEDNAK